MNRDEFEKNVIEDYNNESLVIATSVTKIPFPVRSGRKKTQAAAVLVYNSNGDSTITPQTAVVRDKNKTMAPKSERFPSKEKGGGNRIQSQERLEKLQKTVLNNRQSQLQKSPVFDTPTATKEVDVPADSFSQSIVNNKKSRPPSSSRRQNQNLPQIIVEDLGSTQNLQQQSNQADTKEVKNIISLKDQSKQQITTNQVGRNSPVRKMRKTVSQQPVPIDYVDVVVTNKQKVLPPKQQSNQQLLQLKSYQKITDTNSTLIDQDSKLELQTEEPSVIQYDDNMSYQSYQNNNDQALVETKLGFPKSQQKNRKKTVAFKDDSFSEKNSRPQSSLGAKNVMHDLLNTGNPLKAQKHKVFDQGKRAYRKTVNQVDLNKSTMLGNGSSQVFESDQSSVFKSESSSSSDFAFPAFNQNLRKRTRTLKPSDLAALDQHIKKKYTVMQLQRQFTSLSKEEKQHQSEKYIKKLVKNSEAYFRGREMKFFSGYSFKQCIDNPYQEDTYFTVQHIKIPKKQLTVEAKDQDQKELLVYYKITSLLSDKELVKRNILKNQMNEPSSRRLLSQNSSFNRLQNINAESQNVFVEYGDIESTVPQLEMNYKQALNAPNEYVQIALWHRPVELQANPSGIDIQNSNNPAATADGLNQSGYQACTPIYVPNVLSKSVNDMKNISKTLFVGKNQNVFFFNEETKTQSIILNIIEEASCKSKEEPTPVLESFLTKTKLQQELISNYDQQPKRLIKYQIPEHSLLENQLRYQLMKHKNDKQLLNSIIPDPMLVSLLDTKYLVITQVVIDVKPRILFFELITDDFQSEQSDSLFQEEARPMNISKQPSFTIPGAEILLGTDEKEQNIYFMTNKGLLNGNFTDQSLARLSTPSQVVKISVKQMKYLQQVELREQETQLLKQLNKWDLQTSVENMNRFRVNTVDYFPFMEAILSKDMKGLTVHFSGSEIQPSLAMNFTLIRSADNKAHTEKIRTIIGRYTYLENETIDIKLKIPLNAGKGNSQIIGQYTKDHETQQKFKVQQVRIKSKWFEDNELTMLKTKPTISISQIEIDPETGKIISGLGYKESNGAVIQLTPQSDDQEETASNMKIDSSIAFHNENHFFFNITTTTSKRVIATFEGFSLTNSLQTQILGVYKDQATASISQSLLDQTIKQVSQKLSFYRVQTQSLKFNIHGDDEELHTPLDRRSSIAISRSSQNPSLNVLAANGNMISLSMEHLELLQNYEHSNEKHVMIENVHKIFQNEQGVFILSGSLFKLYKQLDLLDPTEIVLDLTNVSPLPKKLQQQLQVSSTHIVHFSVPAYSIVQNMNYDEELTNEQGLIQDLKICASHEIHTAALSYQRKQSESSINFYIDKLETGVNEEPKVDKIKEFKPTQVKSLQSQSWITEYPLIAYKSFTVNNDSIIIGNLARSENIQSQIDLGKWSFLCFIGFPKLDYLNHVKINPIYCHIFMLVKHRKLGIHRIMIIQMDPWVSHKDPNRHCKALILATSNFNIPSHLSFEELKKAECLVGERVNDIQNLVLLLQFEQNIWAIQITKTAQALGVASAQGQQQNQAAQKVFDGREEAMLPRYMIRSYNDVGHVFCAVQQGPSQKLVKVEISSDNANKVETKDVYELKAGQIAAIECDPEDPSCLYLIDDQQKVQRISETVDGKPIVESKISLEMHNLEDDLKEISAKPWASLCISKRTIAVQDYFSSMNTKFFWKSNEDNSNEKGEPLQLSIFSQKNITNALYQLQLHRKGDNYLFRCKPLPGSKIIDVVGQIRASYNMQMYFVTDDMIMVNFVNYRPIFMDTTGKVVDQPNFDIFKPYNVVSESTISAISNKFILLKDKKQQMSLIECKRDGTLQKRMQTFQIQQLQKTALKNQNHEKLQKILTGNIKGLLNQSRSHLATLQEFDIDLESSFLIHTNQVHLSKSGKVVMIASVVILNQQIDDSQTIFEEHEKQQEQFEDDMDENNLLQDDHQKYLKSKKIVGIYQNQQVVLVVFLCQTMEQQNQIGLTYEQYKTAKKQLRDTVNLNQNEGSSQRYRQTELSTSMYEKSKNLTYKQNFIFCMVSSKLVWFDYNQKTVWHFDIESHQPNLQEDQAASFQWISASCSGFTVKEMTLGITRERFIENGITMCEISEMSTLRVKKIQESHDNDLCLLQLLINQNAIAYNLQAENRYEVALLSDIETYSDPIKFGMTGFQYNGREFTLDLNNSKTLGINSVKRSVIDLNNSKTLGINSVKRSVMIKQSQGLYRNFSEIDLKQIQEIQAQIMNSSNNQLYKGNLIEIEPETTVASYDGETFFSLFAEQDAVYEKVYDRLINLQNEQLQGLMKEDINGSSYQYLKQLNNVLNKPTILTVKEKTYIADLSILKQCLLFKNIKASVMIYKLARIIPNVKFTDYFSSQEDLEIIVDRLPAQQYFKIFNKFGQNYYTRKVNEAILHRKEGKIQQLKIFTQNSLIISKQTPEIGLKRVQTDEEVNRKVLIRVLPLNWIYMDKETGTPADLFNFFRQNLEKLNGCLLLDVIFYTFWQEQQQLIKRYCFYPFILYLFISQIYYLEFMKQNVIDFENQQQRKLDCGLFFEGNLDCDTWQVLEFFTRTTFFTLTVHQTLIEVYQAKHEGWQAHISSKSNFIDIFALGANLYVLTSIGLSDRVEVSMYTTRLVSSMACVALWGQMFFWCRMFDRTAPYVDLIIDTVRDISEFTKLLVIILFVFGSGFHLIQINRLETSYQDEQPFREYIDKDEAYSFISMMFFQYTMLLGDFEKAHFRRISEEVNKDLEASVFVENYLIMVYFIAASFFAQITILNMLIAIMSQTFQKHSESLSELGKKQKLKLMAEYLFLINFYRYYLFCLCQKKNSQVETKCLFMITPLVDEEHIDDQEESQRQISHLKRSIDKRFNTIENLIHRQMVKDISNLSNETKTRIKSLEMDQRYRYLTLTTSIRDLSRRHKEMEEKMSNEMLLKQVESHDNLKVGLTQVQSKMKSELDSVQKNLSNELSHVLEVVKRKM